MRIISINIEMMNNISKDNYNIRKYNNLRFVYNDYFEGQRKFDPTFCFVDEKTSPRGRCGRVEN